MNKEYDDYFTYIDIVEDELNSLLKIAPNQPINFYVDKISNNLSIPYSFIDFNFIKEILR